jgi:2,3-bisphosphoglycerate-independent phosphoglycerate mutase
MGNSEVGHNAMGAGRVFDQGAKLVDNALLHSDAAFDSPVWHDLVATRTLHLIGLVSDGNVHSHVDHLHKLIDRAAADGVQRLRVHVLTDGRDVDGRSALTWIRPLEHRLAQTGRDYAIASGGGRMNITMDRYGADWSMVERGWHCHVHGVGRAFPSATAAIAQLYAEDPDVTDQYLPAFTIVGDHGPIGRIQTGDGVLFFNFRGDRAIEISAAFEDDEVPFERPGRPDVVYAGMMEYDGDTHVPARYLVAPPQIDRTVGEYLAAAGIHTFACSETHKFGHVTFFFNGNRSGKFDADRETYLEIPSDLAPVEERPWMRAAEITDAVIEAIESGDFEHIRLNLANGDMVGHTGHLEATRVAVEAVDLQLARLEHAVERADGILLITADHGNADEMWTRKRGAVQRREDGSAAPRTSHTLAPVPFILVDPRDQLRVISSKTASIASIGATILALCGLTPPDDYDRSLIRTE